MTRLAYLTLFVILVLLAACVTVHAEPKEKLVTTERAEHTELHDIYFAGGCFWGVEEYFSRIPGVVDATTGYANGHTNHPDYASVCSGLTGHAETVHVRYDPKKVSLATLVRQLFKIIDPLSINRQGNDAGTQYRTGIYYSDSADKAELELLMVEEQARHTKTLAVELMPLKKYWLAEDYHQDYLKKHPGGYCHIDFCTLDSLPSSPAETEHEDA
ncbi:MAG: peptide-methionine (S)-S-oxide reductase MsrA, partial [Mailhella sp.]|nr:peptide-methionine (S)-S-oxide reductase MsrA [Mailhella sp.]